MRNEYAELAQYLIYCEPGPATTAPTILKICNATLDDLQWLIGLETAFSDSYEKIERSNNWRINKAIDSRIFMFLFDCRDKIAKLKIKIEKIKIEKENIERQAERERKEIAERTCTCCGKVLDIPLTTVYLSDGYKKHNKFADYYGEPGTKVCDYCRLAVYMPARKKELYYYDVQSLITELKKAIKVQQNGHSQP